MDPTLFDALTDVYVAIDERGDVIWANRAFRAALGDATRDVAGTSIDILLAPMGAESVLEQLRVQSAAEQVRLRLKQRHGEREFELRASYAGDGRVLLTGRTTDDVHHLRDRLARIAELYVATEGESLFDLDCLVETARPAFDDFAWSVVLVRVDDRGVHVTHAIPRPGLTPEIASLFSLMAGRRVDFADVPELRAIIAAATGAFYDGGPHVLPQLIERIAKREADAATYLEGLDRAYFRGAWAPAFGADGIGFVVGAIGGAVRASDVPAIQLFAAQVSATLRAQEMHRTRSAEDEAAALVRMSALLAHEVRNPLAVIFQALRQLRRKLDEATGSHRLMSMVEEEARRLEKLVDDLVHFAAPIDPRLTDVRLHEIVEWALEGVAASVDFPRDMVTVRDAVDPALPSIRADPKLLRRIVHEVVLSASTHVARGGEVLVDAFEDGGGLTLRIHAGGPDLSGEDRARMFEPFFTPHPKGSGLGLAVARRYVEALDGRAQVDGSAPGLCLQVWLPRAPSGAPAAD